MAIYVSSDTVVDEKPLYDVINAVFVNDATCTCAVIDSSGTTLITITLAYVASSSGTYRGTLLHAFTSTLTVGVTYVLETTAISADLATKYVKRENHIAVYA